jgi:HYDIN/CFA65/VesB-like, Ig-like domain
VRKLILSALIPLAIIQLTSCGGSNNTQPPPPSGAPKVTLSPTSLTFIGQVVGTTSPMQAVTLTNSGTASLTISSITPSGDFAVTHNCGASLAASASCSITVSFAPLSGGAESGSVSIADNATGSPQTVTFAGTGMGGLVKLSTDTFTNTTSQHATEVEPDTFANGSQIVSVFQVGRFFDGGASAIGYATSLDGGSTWTNGFLPGITKLQNAANPYDRVSDPAIAYDADHAEWLAASLPILNANVVAPNIIVNRSSDGITWSDPVTVTTTGDYDKNWIACDNWPASPYYGHCYVEWDSPTFALQNRISMSTSTDGGLTWLPALNTANFATGLGGQPVVRPDGTVVVPIANANLTSMIAFTSKDGGASWGNSMQIAQITDHTVAGNLRSDALPSADVDAAGNVYVVWQDCRYRAGCALNAVPNDLVLSTSADGVTWTSPARIPIDAVTSTVDHFIPGIAVEPGTSGNTAHLALTYYYYPVANCTTATCELDVGYISSEDGGANWTAPIQLAGPMNLSSLPSTSQGVMVGDYISTSFVDGLAFGAFAVSNPAAGTVFDQATYTTANGLTAPRSAERFSSAGERPIPIVRSNRPKRLAPLKIR